MINSEYAQQKLSAVLVRIQSACEQAQRPPSSVSLIGASKKQSIELIDGFVACGLKDLGENYLQEAIDKQRQRPELDADWHFIGQIQSKKSKQIAYHFNWVHGVDRLKVAKLLAQHRPDGPLSAQAIKLLIQLNPDDEATKGGVTLAQAPELADKIAQLDHAELKGFMMIPQARQDFQQQRAVFAQAKELLSRVNQRYGLKLDQLSMGMSGDLEAAILEGSTMVRIGTDLFGART